MMFPFVGNLIVLSIRFELKEGRQWSELKQLFVLFITCYSITGKHPNIEDVCSPPTQANISVFHLSIKLAFRTPPLI